MFPIGDDNQPNRGPAILTLALVAVNVLVFCTRRRSTRSSFRIS